MASAQRTASAAGRAAVLSLALLSACSPRLDDAERLQSQGRLVEAAAKYESYAQVNPAAPKAPQALVKAARLYATELGLCARAVPLLEKAARDYPAFKLSPNDYRLLYICPDYFPVDTRGRWVYGDTQTGGRNARQEFLITFPGPDRAVARYALYAGETLVEKSERRYRLETRSFYERQSGGETQILQYPLQEGRSWESTGGEGKLRFLVEKTGVKVKVKAGEFENCVKVRRQGAGQSSWVYEYYAPWTGKVLTSVAGKGFENRVTELLKYEKR